MNQISLYQSIASDPSNVKQDALSDEEFQSARFKAAWHRVFNKVIFKKSTLVDLDEQLADCPMSGQFDLGLQIVPIERIVGSVGRSRDFDRSFLPLQEHTKFRWYGIDKAFHQGVPLPPVKLYQLGDQYFVQDGHHRLSVAKTHGQKFMEAEVIRISTRCAEVN